MKRTVQAIRELSKSLEMEFGDTNVLIEIKVRPSTFDALVREHYKTWASCGLSASRFNPSDAYRFEICGVQISPKFNGGEG